MAILRITTTALMPTTIRRTIPTTKSRHHNKRKRNTSNNMVHNNPNIQPNLRINNANNSSKQPPIYSNNTIPNNIPNTNINNLYQRKNRNGINMIDWKKIISFGIGTWILLLILMDYIIGPALNIIDKPLGGYIGFFLLTTATIIFTSYYLIKNPSTNIRESFLMGMILFILFQTLDLIYKIIIPTSIIGRTNYAVTLIVYIILIIIPITFTHAKDEIY